MGWILIIPGPWGPSVKGELPQQGHVIFQSRHVGSETDDRLIWINDKGIIKSYWVDQVHVGFDYVTIKLRNNGKGLWIESDGESRSITFSCNWRISLRSRASI